MMKGADREGRGDHFGTRWKEWMDHSNATFYLRCIKS